MPPLTYTIEGLLELALERNSTMRIAGQNKNLRQRVRAGTEIYAAVEEGGRVRLRPVLMTALTTILGMVPLAFELSSGSESWSPLARAVIGGLTTSTFLTLLIIPIIYILFNRLAEILRVRIERII